MLRNKRFLTLLHLRHKQFLRQPYLLQGYLNISQIGEPSQFANRHPLNQLYPLQYLVFLIHTLHVDGSRHGTVLGIHTSLPDFEVLEEGGALVVSVDAAQIENAA